MWLSSYSSNFPAVASTNWVVNYESLAEWGSLLITPHWAQICLMFLMSSSRLTPRHCQSSTWSISNQKSSRSEVRLEWISSSSTSRRGAPIVFPSFGGLSSLSQEQKPIFRFSSSIFACRLWNAGFIDLTVVFTSQAQSLSAVVSGNFCCYLESVWLAGLAQSICFEGNRSEASETVGDFPQEASIGVPWVMLLLTIALIWLFPPDRWLSIQLSVLAVIGLQFRQIIQFSSTTPSRISTGRLGSINKIYLYIKEMLITSLCIQIWLFPWLEYYFGGVQFFSLVSAVVIVWLLPALFLFAVPLLPVLLIIPTALLRSTIVALLFWPIHAHLFFAQLVCWVLLATLCCPRWQQRSPCKNRSVVCHFISSFCGVVSSSKKTVAAFVSRDNPKEILSEAKDTVCASADCCSICIPTTALSARTSADFLWCGAGWCHTCAVARLWNIGWWWSQWRSAQLFGTAPFLLW